MRKTIKINNIDFTDCFTPVGYKVTHKKIEGPNKGYMLDGSYREDVLAIKAVIALTCMPLSAQKLHELLDQLYSGSLSVYFFDPRTNAYRTAEMMCNPPESVDKGFGSNEVNYWAGMILVMTEK